MESPLTCPGSQGRSRKPGAFSEAHAWACKLTVDSLANKVLSEKFGVCKVFGNTDIITPNYTVG